MKNYFAVILLVSLFATQACAQTEAVAPPSQPTVAQPNNTNTKFKSVQQKQEMEQEKKDLATLKKGVVVDDVYVACKYYFSKLFNTRENSGRKNICNGYFFGASSMIILLQDEKIETNTCLPMDISTEEMIKTFIKWSEANPDKGKMQASQALLEMMRESYPCNEYRPKKKAGE